MQSITTIGLDIAKSVFQVHGVDAAGQAVVRRQLKRRHYWSQHGFARTIAGRPQSRSSFEPTRDAFHKKPHSEVRRMIRQRPEGSFRRVAHARWLP
jgi:hypothetical protein